MEEEIIDFYYSGTDSLYNQMSMIPIVLELFTIFL